MIKEFKAFIMRGNVLDLAVALILATYFGLIIKSLVDDVIMPVAGKMMGGVDFAQMKYVIQEASVDATSGDVVAEVAVKYGILINTIITFIIVAFCVFLIVKAYNKAQKPAEEEEAGPSDNDLLVEIRDLLKK